MTNYIFGKKEDTKFEEQYNVAHSIRAMSCKGLGFHALACEIHILYPGLTVEQIYSSTKDIYSLIFDEEQDILSLADILFFVQTICSYRGGDYMGTKPRGGNQYMSCLSILQGLLDIARGSSKKLQPYMKMK